jgi:C4-dicarboxylate-specific signal transduction histidine kinase
VAAALLLTQIGVMAAQHFATPGVERVTSYQAVLIVLATTGLTIGVLISERSRNERRLRLQQDAIARVTRLGSVGELAAALAHELNQPLTAAGNYGRAALGLMRRSPQSPTEAVDAVAKAVEQIDRGSAVMRKLRRFIQVGELERRAHAPKAIIEESLDLVRHDLPAPPVAFSVLVPADVPRVLADLVHIEQVLVNLIRNAVEALTAADTPAPRIAIAARAIAGGYVEFTVTDNGPGFPPEFRLALSVPLASTKVDGLGVGLSLCQSIVRAHDGVLRIDNSPGGAIVSFTLPVSPGKANGTID